MVDPELQSYKDTIKRNLAVIEAELSNSKHLTLDAQSVYNMAVAGVTEGNICKLFHLDVYYISKDPSLLEAYHRGRAQIGARIRASLVDDALNNDMPYAKIHLDKVLNKDDNTTKVDVSVTQQPLKDVPIETLLSIEIDDDTEL